jgi:hypothetical protein
VRSRALLPRSGASVGHTDQQRSTALVGLLPLIRASDGPAARWRSFLLAASCLSAPPVDARCTSRPPALRRGTATSGRMPFGRGTHVVCGRCGGAGERPRQRSSKELKREAGRAKLARRALELEALLSSHPAVTGCVVEPQAPGKLACAHVQLVPSAPDVSVANSNTLLLASIMGWLDQETRQVGEPARADGALRFFPGGVHVVEQLPRRPSVPPAKRPWDQCDACDGSGLVAAAGASNISQPVEAGPLIAVVGGGIGGAALAVALQQRGMRVVVYERDESFSSRCVSNPTVCG